MLMIRFQRIGRKNDAAFRIAVLEKERAAKAGGIVERVGSYNPKTKALVLDKDRVKEWLAKGAQPSDTVRNLLISQGVIEGKKVNVLPKKTAPVVEAPAKEVSSAPAAEAVPAEEAAAPTEEPATEAAAA